MFLKKILALTVMVLFVIVSFSACGNERQESPSTGETPEAQATSAEAPPNEVDPGNTDSNKEIESKGEVITNAGDNSCSHNYCKENITRATCTSAGYTTYRCKKCGEKKIGQETAALNHNYDGGSITKPASCIESGIKTFTCANCHHAYSEPISALGHTFNEWTASGKVHKHTCSRCGSEETSSHIWDSDGDECVDCGIINFD
ncbi:MAG: hypothetical protein RUMPE_00897 [Eubacteriales bacterium SKADARSKE-1]|nr:hypothetical protein [Eubacteriales bacterium SKADARSKE-1]